MQLQRNEVLTGLLVLATIAALTGILHGKSASYLSTIMPNTFSMAPRYVRDFAARTDFHSPERDVFDGLELKLGRLYRQAPPQTPGVALLGVLCSLGNGAYLLTLTLTAAWLLLPSRARMMSRVSPSPAKPSHNRPTAPS